MVEEKKEEVVKQVVKQEPSTPYLVARFIEMLCIGAFVFGFLWNGTEVLNLSTPQFMMLYGGTGAALAEVIARVIKKKQDTG